jgi:hypothetical protein
MEIWFLVYFTVLYQLLCLRDIDEMVVMIG